MKTKYNVFEKNKDYNTTRLRHAKKNIKELEFSWRKSLKKTSLLQLRTPHQRSVRNGFITNYSLRENCPYSELFWSAFSRIRTE